MKFTDTRCHFKLQRAKVLWKKPTIRQVMRFLGTLEACMLVVKCRPMYNQALEDEKNKAMEEATGKLEERMNTRMRLSQHARGLVRWWLNEAHLHPRPLLQPCGTKFMQTASKRGWGTCLLDGEGGQVLATAGAAWANRMKSEHINVLELEAIRKGFTVLLPDIVDTHVLVETDNVTAATYLTKMGGVKSEPCRFPAHLIWKWLLEKLLDVWK